MLRHTQLTMLKAAAEAGRVTNNELDCDVIQDAISQLESYKSSDEEGDALESLAYLSTAVAFRTRQPEALGMYRGFVDYFRETTVM